MNKKSTNKNKIVIETKIIFNKIINNYNTIKK